MKAQFLIPKTYLSIIAFISIFSAGFYLFYPSLNYYFFQDDWFVLNWVRTGDLRSSFAFRGDIIYWRPLSMPLFFTVNKALFGLNPLGFHLMSLTFFFALVLAVYLLFKKLLNDKNLAILASFLYATWSIHFISLSWLSTTSYITGPFFAVLSFFFFIKFIEEKKAFFWIISFLLFILGLASSEMVIILPAIIFIWGFLLKKQNFVKVLIPFVALNLIYLVIRFILVPIPAVGQYQPIFSRQVLDNFLWYLAWGLGFPEAFKTLIYPSLPHRSLSILVQFWHISVPAFLTLFLVLKLLIENLRKNLKFYLFGFSWVIIGLLPVITLINHAYPIYLSFAGLGIIFTLAQALKFQQFKWFLLLVIFWFSTSWANLRFTRFTHWLVGEQSISRVYTSWAKDLVPNPANGSIFIFKSADRTISERNRFVILESEDTLKLSLNDQTAMQVIYDDLTITSYYPKQNQSIQIFKDKEVYEIRPHEE